MFRLHKAAGLVEDLGSQVSKLAQQASHRGFRSTKLYRRAAEGAPAEESIPGIPYSKLTIGVPKESAIGENRVAIVPATCATLIKKGFTINVEEGAGLKANFSNADYEAAGAKVTSSKEAFHSDIVFKVQKPNMDEVSALRGENTLYSFLYPAQNKELVDALAAKKASVFAMDCVPRISRAQTYDALSSMANISGYKAVLLAANNFGRFFTGIQSHSTL